MWRRHLTADHYGNSLPILLNERYRRYNDMCRKTFKPQPNADERAAAAAEALRRDGFYVIENAIPENLAHRLSERITAKIERTPQHNHQAQTRHLQYVVEPPIGVLGEEVLDLFRGPADHAIRLHLNSFYRLHQVKCYRSIPAENPIGAWLWHTDNYPPEVKKIMLYLTDCNPENGVTSFISLEHTAKLQRAGYFGVNHGERRGDLESYARDLGVDIDVKWNSIKAGSAILFEVNTLHRANIPRLGFRDVVTFTLMPSPIAWDVELARRGIERLEAEKAMYPIYPGSQAS